MLNNLIIFILNFLSKILPKLAAKLAMALFSRPKRFKRTQQELALFTQARQINFASGCVANEWSNDFTQKHPIILLVHGWESRGTTFHVLINQLLAQNFHVIAWNAPAHGASKGKKTNLLHITKTLAADLAEKNIKPNATVGHSMGGATIALLSKYTALPKSITLISSPTDIHGIFVRYFDIVKLSKKTQAIVIENISRLSEFDIHQISLINMDIYKTSDILVIHDKSDKEIPFDDFLNLQKIWHGGEFYPTDGLGHRRILRDEKLCQKITQHILDTIE